MSKTSLRWAALRKKIPLVFWCYIVGGGALAAIPWVTVGFYSKEAILWETYATGHLVLFYMGVFGAFLTATLYVPYDLDHLLR